MGDSVGHWEGDTLVVDVIGFNDKTCIAGGGTIHSKDLHVVERYTPTSGRENPLRGGRGGSQGADADLGRLWMGSLTFRWRGHDLRIRMH